MSVLELLWRSVGALLLGTAHLYVALRVTLALGLRRSIFLATMAFLAVALGGAALAFHLLIAVHLYTLPCAIGLSVLACAAAGWATRSQGSTELALRRIALGVRRVRRLVALSPHRGRIYFFGITSLLLGVRALLYVPNSHDTIVYHATKAALWVQQNDLGAMWGPGQWELYGLFPGGGELFTSLAMLPFRHDVYACAVDMAMWVGLGFACLAFNREVGVREPYGSIAAGFVLGIPTFRLLVGSGYNEEILCFAFMLGAYFAIRYVRSPRGPLALLAIMSLGVAASTKFNMMVPAAMASFVVLVRALAAWRRRPRDLAWGLAGGVLALAVILPWLVLSVRRTGYPLSPLPIKVAGVTLGVSRIFELFMRDATFPTPYVWENEWPLAKLTFGLPVGELHETVGVFVAIPMVLAPLGWVSLVRRRPLRASILVLISAASLWTYLEPHMAQVRFLWMYSASRFLLPFLCLAVPSSLLFARGRYSPNVWIGRALWAGFIVNAICFGLPWLTEYDVYGAVLVALMAAVSGVIARAAWTKLPRRPFVLAAVHAALLVSFTLGLFAYKDPRRFESIRDGTVLHPYNRDWWVAAERLDVEGERKVAITSGTNLPCIWPTYHFLGRRFQNHLVYVSPLPDGRRPGFCPSDGWEPDARFETWLARLRAADIREVVSFSPGSVELRWMEQHPDLFAHVMGIPGEMGYFTLRKQP